MALTKRQHQDALLAAGRLPLDHPQERVEDFFAGALSLTVGERLVCFPSPDPGGLLAKAVAFLTKQRESMLRSDGRLPPYVVWRDAASAYQIAGLLTYLNSNGASPQLLGRLSQHEKVRKALLTLQRGHRLEAVAAAILQSRLGFGSATCMSGDQGIDALGWSSLLPLERAFVDGDVDVDEYVPGDRSFVLASSKAVAKAPKSRLALVNPAHIRELIGGWVIQRSTIGKWQEHGLKMLTPMQMVFVTTYKLSDDATQECRKLGVPVWSFPELIYLVCKSAPDSVFDAAAAYTFQADGFRDWWKPFDDKRAAS